MSASPNVTRAWRYARAVVSGKVIASKWTRLACQWMLDDYKKAKDSKFKWAFDKEKAEYFLECVQLFHHVKGEKAKNKETIYLEDWQCFFIGMIFGWVSRESGYRRFTLVLLFVARKNTKSTLAAAIGNLMLTADDEEGAEVYSGATSEKQAWEVFGPALAMVKKNDFFKDCFGVEPHASNISVPGTNSKFEPLIGKPGEGANPSCSIHDEYHEHETDEQVDTMKTGMGSRRQGLQLIITTAGDNTTGPCAKLVENSKKNLEGSLRDDRTFPLMYCRDEPDDETKGDRWDSVAAMKKANPNLGVSVYREFLDHQLFVAKNDPEKQTSYRTKHLNEFVGSRKAYFNVARWKKAANPKIQILDYVKFDCYLALDLASKIDIAALDILFDLGDNKFAQFGKYYVPEARVETGENKNYKTWVEQGWLTSTPGERTDFDLIKEDVLTFCNMLQVSEVIFDPYQAAMMISQLQKKQINCVELPNQVRYFSEPMKDMQSFINGGNIIHNGNPLYTWMLSNVTAKKDAKDNVFPRKQRDENKIDGPVATIMNFNRALSGQEVDDDSFIDEPLMVTL